MKSQVAETQIQELVAQSLAILFKIPLFLRRHIHTRPIASGIRRLPKTRHSLLLRVKLQSRLPIKRVRASARHTLLVAREAEHRQGHRDGHVDANLPSFDLFLETRRGGAGRGEDGGAVAVFVGVDELDGFIQRVDVKAYEDGAEDFFFVAAVRQRGSARRRSVGNRLEGMLTSCPSSRSR